MTTFTQQDTKDLSPFLKECKGTHDALQRMQSALEASRSGLIDEYAKFQKIKEQLEEQMYQCEQKTFAHYDVIKNAGIDVLRHLFELAKLGGHNTLIP